MDCLNFKGQSIDGVKEKVFPLSLEGKALTWHRLCEDTETWEWNRLKLEFHQKFYPMHLVHRDRNYIYSFWPREGESITQAWGRLKYMLKTYPNHELSREIIIQNFYARLFYNDQSMLDTSSASSFMKKTIEGGRGWCSISMVEGGGRARDFAGRFGRNRRRERVETIAGGDRRRWGKGVG